MSRGISRSDCSLAARSCLPCGNLPPRGAREIKEGKDKQPFILAAGRLWDEAKNVVALDRVAADLPWPVRIAGDAAHPDGHIFAASHATLLGRLDAAAMAEQYASAAIYAGGGGVAAVGCEGDAVGEVGVAGELSQLITRRRVPEADVVIVAAGQDLTAVAGNRDAIDVDGMIEAADLAA